MLGDNLPVAEYPRGALETHPDSLTLSLLRTDYAGPASRPPSGILTMKAFETRPWIFLA
ncbi:MAG: hypothetical protein RIF32_17865 [Leptospirales bacterium]